MRSILTLACFIFFTVSFGQSPEDSRSKETFAKNKVKNQISWDYKYVGEKVEKSGTKTSITTFSPNGEIIQVNALNPKGLVLHTEKYSYDSRGNKTAYTRTSGDNSYQKKYSYNDKNQLTEEGGFDGVENFRNVYTYNAQGEVAEIRYMKNTVLSEKRVFEKNGSTTTVSVYGGGKTLTSKLILKYDPKGNLVEESVYGLNQNALEKKTYNYDEKKNLKEEAKYKLDKITLKTTYSYNSTGALLEISEEGLNTAKFVKKSLKYDARGNLIELKWRRKGAEDFNCITYQYDSRDLCITADTYYPATKYRVLTKYTYE